MRGSCTVLVGSSSSSLERLGHLLCCRRGGTRRGCRQRVEGGEKEEGREVQKEMGAGKGDRGEIKGGRMAGMEGVRRADW